ncbi:PilC/PilY family type IV pilus protein [Myxococcus sp. RHSTA-1-4]|uniref:PilC/PilY family type IV pilus protein n=1 Tax=Myxococcus sp. RHSTA-1-4 TaxID=2874601 RepID=UPI001CBCD87D|nr:PilC/PilY family type IV pilus protein [Myxococcus sp. RHSTA-1-4]MBZ4414922.1 pilus assembly protein PilY [Myxococcus sp. RHSTA-1-4]
MKVLLTSLPVLVVLLAAPRAHALDAAACTLQSTSRLDAMLNPARGSDERFFTNPSGPPNILIILDTSGSMAWWPMAWSNNDSHSYDEDASGADPGCRQGNINALNYDPNVTYPRLWLSLTNQNSPWFDPAKFYRFDGYGSGTQVSFGMNNNPVRFDLDPPGTIITTSESAACTNLVGTNASDAAARAACQSCLQRKGYFQWKADRRVAAGNFLNFYSPRGHSAVNVITQVIRDSAKTRFGIMTFSAGSGATGTVKWDGEDVVRFAPFGPACSDANDAAARNTHRDNLLVKMKSGLRFNTGTPLTQVLWGSSYYFRASTAADDPFPGWFGASYLSDPDFNDEASPGRASACFTCSFNSMILLTDGEPNEPGDSDSQIPQAVRDLNVPCDNCAAAGQGEESGGDESHIHRIAKWMWTHDMRPELTGTQGVATYTVGFALTNTPALNLLRTTAEVGGGRFFAATNSSQLKTALQSIVDDVQSRNIAFAAAAISSFQTGSSTLSALMPRLSPAATGSAWRGDLWRFNQFNEFVQNSDKNGDGDVADIFVVDQDNDIVVEDSTGNFVKDGTATPARQFWEARRALLTRALNTRKIYTVTDSSADGRLGAADDVIEFTVANRHLLKDYLGVVGTPACPKLESLAPLAVDPGSLLTGLKLTPLQAATAMGMPAPAWVDLVTGQQWLDDLCLRTLIQYVRGQDLADEDGNGNRTEVRRSVLGDIFHSSPVLVDPPMDKFLCNLGMSTQCARTLYSDTLGVTPTPLAREDIVRCGHNVNVDAYEAYLHRFRKRDKLVLVGANDGMVHAFRDSTATETCTGGLPFITYTPSTGEEEWAFIPPDLLSRLHELASGHQYFVDGDIMVRDIWADGSGGTAADEKKQSTEYKTLAVVSEGRGGVHYLALELEADETSGRFLPPKLRWMFPQPDSEEAALFGKTLFSLSPKAPPIGPLLVKAPPAATDPVSRYGVDTQERWMVALSGGWSPGMEKGRGVYLVDAWNPEVNGRGDNLWWKFEYNPNATEENDRPARHLTHSVAAPVALVDYSVAGAVKQDGFFDTAVFGDMRGQLWVARMSVPGEVDSTTKLIKNWGAARAFQMDRDASSSAGVGQAVSRTWPFYYVPSIGIQPNSGALRALIGTGDRYALLDDKAGICRFDNPQACAKYGCGEVEVDYRVDRVGRNVTLARQYWKPGEIFQTQLTTTPSTQTACGNPGDTVVTAEFERYDVKSCPGAPQDYTKLSAARVECGQDAAGNFRCLNVSTTASNFADLELTRDESTLGKNRFFGIRVYGGPGQTFEEGRATPAPGVKTAREFDDERLTDRTATHPDSGDLVDVTNITCTAPGNCTAPGAPANGAGWLVEYSGMDHKTAGGASTVASCALWNVLYPATSGTACDSTSAKARFFQGHYLTGLPTCAESLENQRFQERAVLAPPPEPATAVMVSSTGKVKYSTVLQEPGKRQATSVDVAELSDVLQNVYELPLSNEQHQCRHVDPARCVASP